MFMFSAVFKLCRLLPAAIRVFSRTQWRSFEVGGSKIWVVFPLWVFLSFILGKVLSGACSLFSIFWNPQIVCRSKDGRVEIFMKCILACSQVYARFFRNKELNVIGHRLTSKLVWPPPPRHTKDLRPEHNWLIRLWISIKLRHFCLFLFLFFLFEGCFCRADCGHGMLGSATVEPPGHVDTIDPARSTVLWLFVIFVDLQSDCRSSGKVHRR